MADTRWCVGITVSLFVALAASCSDDSSSVASNSGGSTSSGGSGNGSGTGGGTSGGSGGSGGIVIGDTSVPSDKDTDDDGMTDAEEGTGDYDGDGKPNFDDPINDGPPPAVTFIAISTTFNSPIGIDYHEPSNTVVMSVNYPAGTPSGFERIHFDGSHEQFSSLSALTDEVKIATARSKNPSGFTVGDLFVGNGVDGQIVRITGDGSSVINPWVDLPGDNNGLMRGSLYVDRTGVFNGDLVVVTTAGEVWRVDVAGTPTKIAAVPGVHLEGAVIVPNKPNRFGPVAGKLLAGSEVEGLMYAFATDGTYVTYALGVAIEDIDIISPNENFFGVNYGTSQLLGAGAEQFNAMMGDVMLTTETVVAGASGLFRLKFDGTQLLAEPVPLGPGSAVVGQWEHTTFAAAGIKEIPPVPK